MAKLEDYGIRIIDHGCWSDPEVEWKKSDFQTLLFNYWDCVECFENDDYDLSKEEDIETLYDLIWNLTPSEYDCPSVYYEWEVTWGRNHKWVSDDKDFFEDNKLSRKKDYVLHNSSQAFKQALQFMDDNGIMKAKVEIFRHGNIGRTLEYIYSVNGSTLKDRTNYKKFT